MTDVYIAGKRHQLSPAKSIGKGGEADVYDLGNGQVVKVFKRPDHPDLDGDPIAQKAAEARIAQHQTKLKAFPRGLPSRVVAPVELATNKSGSEVLGYTMPFLKGSKVLLQYTERSFRATIGNDVVTRIFRDLHGTVGGIHKAKVVIGDFNDLNILVAGEEAWVIDADSMQFGKWFCQVFTARFVDPLLCDQSASSPNLVKPHNEASDWYAFNTMLFQCLLFVSPYGGVYRPADPRKKIQHDARPLHRITVFDPEVKYPKPATRPDVLPDDLLHHFKEVFHSDQRREFPANLLEMQWTTCAGCGLEFSRRACPVCAKPAPGAVKTATVMRGTVTSTRFFQTSGRILHACVQGGQFRWLWNENGEFRREVAGSSIGRVVMRGTVDPRMRFRISGDSTLVGQGSQVVALNWSSGAAQPADSQFSVDTYRQIPMFDATESSRFWIHRGRLLRDARKPAFPDDIEEVGQVLEDQTLFWVGASFGIGFYRADKLCVAFTFRTDAPGLNDSVKIPSIRGQLIDATCCFSKDRAWLTTSAQDAGVIKNQTVCISSKGEILGTAEATAGDGSWLSALRGKTAAGSWLFAATDDGIVRLEADAASKKIVVTKEFPDTEPFVDASAHLFVGPQGLYVVSSREIRLLKIG
jgi:tRNA A-37 threonylcarbamoyl transferase component Bud32